MRSCILLPLLLLGCQGASDDSKDGRVDRLVSLENRGIGRFQMVPASDNFPPMFIDTATGCVMALSNYNKIKKSPIIGPDGRLDSACFDRDNTLAPADDVKESLK